MGVEVGLGQRNAQVQYKCRVLWILFATCFCLGNLQVECCSPKPQHEEKKLQRSNHLLTQMNTSNTCRPCGTNRGRIAFKGRESCGKSPWTNAPYVTRWDLKGRLWNGSRKPTGSCEHIRKLRIDCPCLHSFWESLLLKQR